MLSFMNVKAHSQKFAFGSVSYIVNQFLVNFGHTNKQGSETELLKTERELKVSSLCSVHYSIGSIR